MAFVETGAESLRLETYDATIKQLVDYAYKFKQLVSVTSAGGWKDHFWREQTTILAGQSGNATRGIPRGADFPNASLSWEKVTTTIEKYGLEQTIDYEDIVSDEIDIRNRTLLRIAEGVAKAVDDEIYDVLKNDSGIQTGTLQAGYWDESSAAIIKDLAKMKAQVKTYYNNVSDFVCVIHPDNEPNVLHYIYEKGAQATTAGQKAFNGEIGSPAGVSIITSSAVDASYALFLVPKRCATWKSLMPLSTDTEVKKFKGDTITACEMGVTQVHEPKQIVNLQTIA